jgi:hypothetical protein
VSPVFAPVHKGAARAAPPVRGAAQRSSQVPEGLFSTRVRYGLLALILLLAGAFLFVLVILCTIGFLADRNCGDAFGYYGCAANSSLELRNSGAR